MAFVWNERFGLAEFSNLAEERLKQPSSSQLLIDAVHRSFVTDERLIAAVERQGQGALPLLRPSGQGGIPDQPGGAGRCAGNDCPIARHE
ncbi:MAG: hypothetical protein WAZ34_08915 [Rhodocyclaceae bacterium]